MQSSTQQPRPASAPVDQPPEKPAAPTPASAGSAMTPMPKPNARRIPIWALAVSLMLVLIAVEGIAFFFDRTPPAPVLRVAEWLRFPVGKVNAKFIPYSDFVRDYHTLTTLVAFQRQQSPDLVPVDVGDDELRQVTLDRLIHNTMIEQLAARRSLAVTTADIDQDFQRAIGTAPMADIEQQVKQQFDLSVADYKARVVRIALLRDQLDASIARDQTINGDLQKRAEGVLAEVKGSQEPFDALAVKYSEDSSTKLDGGDLGVLRADQFPKEFLDAVKNLKAGERSDLVRTNQGYHIVELVESVAPDTDGTLRYHPRHILIRGKSLDAWITEQLAAARVAAFIPGLTWNKTASRVDVQGQQG